MIYEKKKSVQKYLLLILNMGPRKFLYNSTFDFTAKSLVTNTVVITRVLCINLTLLHSKRPKLYGVLTVLSAIGLSF